METEPTYNIVVHFTGDDGTEHYFEVQEMNAGSVPYVLEDLRGRILTLL